MARRVDIEALIARYGVAGLARKVGVHSETVRRWRGIVDPSPLATDKLKGLLSSKEHQQQDTGSARADTAGPTRQPADVTPSAESSGGMAAAPAPVRRAL